MKNILICVFVVLTACGVGFAKDKYSRPHYRTEADVARKHPRSLSKGAAAQVVTGTNQRGTKRAPKLDQQLKQLELQNAKAAGGTNAKAAAKARTSSAIKPLPEQKNHPINFRYVPSKNATVQNRAAGKTSRAPTGRKLR
jgi:hypothetical protein